VTLDGAELSYFGQEGLSEVVSGSVTFQFQCAIESTNGTGVQGGQIPELLFYGPNPPAAEAEALPAHPSTTPPLASLAHEKASLHSQNQQEQGTD
jgi:hypothetical protein